MATSRTKIRVRLHADPRDREQRCAAGHCNLAHDRQAARWMVVGWVFGMATAAWLWA